MTQCICMGTGSLLVYRFSFWRKTVFAVASIDTGQVDNLVWFSIRRKWQKHTWTYSYDKMKAFFSLSPQWNGRTQTIFSEEIISIIILPALTIFLDMLNTNSYQVIQARLFIIEHNDILFTLVTIITWWQWIWAIKNGNAVMHKFGCLVIKNVGVKRTLYSEKNMNSLNVEYF